MCWGMISYNHKGPLYVWIPETKNERTVAEAEIAKLNSEIESQEKELNDNWVGSPEWKILKEQELVTARVQRAAEQTGAPKKTIPQTWRSKNFRIERIPNWSKKGGVDTYRYINEVCKPLLRPDCKRLLERNPEFCLMEDGAGAHKSAFTTNARIQEGIKKVDWPPNSLDFHPIERIWTLMKRRILRRRGAERITTVKDMRRVLVEEWDKIAIEEINKEIERLPSIMVHCIAVNGGNNFQA